MTTEHLTDADWDELVAAPQDASRFKHLNECASCRSIAESLASDAVPARLLVKASRQRQAQRRAAFPWRALSAVLFVGCISLSALSFHFQGQLRSRRGREVTLDGQLATTRSELVATKARIKPERPPEPEPRVVASIVTTEDDVLNQWAKLKPADRGEVQVVAGDAKAVAACLKNKGCKRIGRLEMTEAAEPLFPRVPDNPPVHRYPKLPPGQRFVLH